MRKVLIATGGSGGHLFPAQAAADDLVDCKVLFAGHNLSSSPFFDQTRAHVEIASSNRNPLTLLKGFWQSFRLILRFQPDVVVGFGSFHSLPLLVAAVLCRKKIVLFEANCSFGKVTKALLPFAAKTALQFPFHQGPNVAYVPLLPWNSPSRRVEQDEARRFYGLRQDLFTILVFGGSQGAKVINETFYKAARVLNFPFQVIHLTGKEDPTISYDAPHVVKPFEKQMHYAYAAADMAVCRCGAGATAELIKAGLPAVLIPYPYAYDHQRKNGEFLQNGARLLLQKEMTVEKLAAEIVLLRENLSSHKNAMKHLALPKTEPLSTIIRRVV